MKTTIQTARRHLAEIDLGHSLNAVRDHMLEYVGLYSLLLPEGVFCEHRNQVFDVVIEFKLYYQ